MKLKMFIELEYDADTMHDEDGKAWFFDEILGDKEGLILYSNELGDEVGRVTVLQEFTCEYCGAPSEIDPSDQTPPPAYCYPEDHRSFY